MIKLTSLLLESITSKTPKAIFLAGPAGSGKSYISDKLFPKSNFKTINIDDTYEELLQTSGLSLGYKDLYKADPSSAKSIKFSSLHSIFAPRSKTTFTPF